MTQSAATSPGPESTKFHSVPDLLQAFLQADYVVVARGMETRIRVGNLHPALDAVAAGRNWAIITGCNPQAKQADERTNRQRQQALINAVAETGLEYHHACNCDPAGNWPDEPGLFIIGIEDETARTLARQFGQAGIVTGRNGRPAELWLFGDGWPAQLPSNVVRSD